MNGVTAALDLYCLGLAGRRRAARSHDRVRARTQDGRLIALPLQRWLRDPSRAEHRLLRDLEGPVLDVGCGPCRHAAALHARGVAVLGVDIAATAVRLARARGAPVLQRSVFDLPPTGSWGSALLLDGNIGIGGDPLLLLARVATLVRPGGVALIELEAPGEAARAFRVRLERAGAVSDWFPWALVGVDGIEALAARCDFEVTRVEPSRGRWFARLTRAPGP
ncbi:MAG: class I SAM-dependent methyltransferase [Solirubrobacteraceae bacterium]